MIYCCICILILTAIGKTVRCYIKYSHDNGMTTGYIHEEKIRKEIASYEVSCAGSSSIALANLSKVSFRIFASGCSIWTSAGCEIPAFLATSFCVKHL